MTPVDNTIVVIPAYNEAASIRAIVQRAAAQCTRVIVIDDGSTDNTSAQLDGLPTHITLLRHERNQGKARALLDGFRHALGMQPAAQFIVSLDADGQHRPEDLPRLLQAAAQWPQHIVVGARLSAPANMPAGRRRANKVANFWIGWAAGYPVADSQSGFRVYPAAVLQAVLPVLARRYSAQRLVRRPLADHRKGFVLESELLIIAGRRGVPTVAVEIPSIYDQLPRASHFKPVADITQIVIMVAGYLLRWGMHPLGLRRSLRTPAKVARL